MKKGITLVETMITISIIILIIAVALPSIGYFSDATNWSGKDAILKSMFNLALSQSSNKYAGVKFYVEDDKQYAQIVELDSNAYCDFEPKAIILKSTIGFKPHCISESQIVYPAINNEIVDVNSFYIVFYRNQLREHLYIYDDEQIVRSYKSVAIDNAIYAINRYLGNLISLEK